MPFELGCAWPQSQCLQTEELWDTCDTHAICRSTPPRSLGQNSTPAWSSVILLGFSQISVVTLSVLSFRSCWPQPVLFHTGPFPRVEDKLLCYWTDFPVLLVTRFVNGLASVSGHWRDQCLLLFPGSQNVGRDLHRGHISGIYIVTHNGSKIRVTK